MGLKIEKMYYNLLCNYFFCVFAEVLEGANPSLPPPWVRHCAESDSYSLLALVNFQKLTNKSTI